MKFVPSSSRCLIPQAPATRQPECFRQREISLNGSTSTTSLGRTSERGHQAAVYHQVAAGDVGGAGAGEEDDEVGDLFGGGEAARGSGRLLTAHDVRRADIAAVSDGRRDAAVAEP